MSGGDLTADSPRAHAARRGREPPLDAGVADAGTVDARAGRSLDLLNLFVANIQTGFGPFVAVYLTTQGWTDAAIGFALSLGTLTAMASQLPAGALVDAARSKARVGFFSIAAFCLSALLFAIWPVPLSVYLAEVLHGFSSCTLGPVIAAISLAIAGPGALGLRLGRNARFASIGNGVGAALMGACGYYLPEAFVFYLTAALTLPALAVLRPLSGIGDSAHVRKAESFSAGKTTREQGQGSRQALRRPPADDLRPLGRPFHLRQCGDAAAGGQHADQAGGGRGGAVHRRLHRPAPDRGGAALPLGRRAGGAPRPAPGAPAGLSPPCRCAACSSP